MMSDKICKIILMLCWFQNVKSMSLLNKHLNLGDGSSSESDIANFINLKKYIPKDSDLPRLSIIKDSDNEASYLLSKLSDEALLGLLSDQPAKSEYDLNDIFKVALDSKSSQAKKLVQEMGLRNFGESNNGHSNKRFKTVPGKPQSQSAYFRLEDKEVDPYSMNVDADPNYVAVQKLNNLLNSRTVDQDIDGSLDEDDKKELLFDVLVGQLKKLCCKKNKNSRTSQVRKYKALLDGILPTQTKGDKNSNEHMFLIVNDELKNTESSNDLTYVDPDSLNKNSSVVLLGPITSPLSNSQLQLVMNRISNELSKPVYTPLLQQLASGTLTDKTLAKSVFSGSETRRYIKPHRCNHQSKLAKVYGGPKWLICTGYLNLNTPSLYD